MEKTATTITIYGKPAKAAAEVARAELATPAPKAETQTVIRIIGKR